MIGVYIQYVTKQTNIRLEAIEERVHLFLIGKTQYKEKNINSLIFIQGSIVHLSDLSPIPGEIDTVVESAASHSFLTA